ncbi:heavy metal transporter [Streptomyces sp. TS71-3]|uniref:heavy metal transporter n=1 Tax=Streptomyces sp. TS71-3 TaxID=2733862 RepID=UPI0020177B8F|nr:heavy metal transporter [Streptomyces sp. TS71-3]
MAAAFLVLLALAGYLAMRYTTGGRTAPRCTVVSGRGGDASYHFSPEQAGNAATISAVGTSRGMPERAVVIALATALQESDLHNLDHGDRDSVGLFQQRPSQGWGTTEKIMDPAYAAGAFYTRLNRVPGYARLPVTVAAQHVQRSGFPEAYARHEPEAALLAAALTGRAPATLTCEGGGGRMPGDPDRVRRALVHDFGSDVLAPAASSAPRHGTSATGSRTTGERAGGARAGSAGSDRHMVTVPVRAAAGKAATGARQRGWALAHWAVANSVALHITQVGYGGRQWSGDTGTWGTAGGDGKSGASAGGTDRVLIDTAG